jgi:SsrA-binding protein
MCAKKNTAAPAKKNAPAKSTAIKIVCENRKAKFDYQLHERFEAGLVLTGSEVKSLRLGKANLTNAYGDIHNAEAYLVQAEIQPYDKGGYANHEPLRRRKLLLHREEINKLLGRTQAKGFTVVPLKIYFKNGRAKARHDQGTRNPARFAAQLAQVLVIRFCRQIPEHHTAFLRRAQLGTN